jgi:hypothetical protein
MKLFKLVAGLAMACLLLSVAGCATTLSDAIGGITTAAGLTVTRHDAIVVADSMRTIQDTATSFENGCEKAGLFTGACADGPVTTVHNALVASRKARDDLLSFANTHADLPAGIGGVYQLATSALADLQSALKQFGVKTPPVPAPATGS